MRRSRTWSQGNSTVITLTQDDLAHLKIHTGQYVEIKRGKLGRLTLRRATSQQPRDR